MRLFLFTAWIALITITEESPIEGSTLPPEPISDNHAHRSHDKSEEGSSNLSGGEEPTAWNIVKQEANRFNYSRQISFATTLGYDEWWYATTRRPAIYLKDFPGKPGVATWKEIYPSSSSEGRQSRKMEPTAEGVSSNSRSQLMNSFPFELLSYILAILFIRCLCWTRSL